MDKETGQICTEGLTFFGRTNRFISHELKNILAIISETLGLIDELMELAGSGRELEPGKLRSLSKSVIEEVERANGIIKSMNSFGHSVDEFVSMVDIEQTLNLMIGLLRLDPASRDKEVIILTSETNTVYSSPFFMGNLLYRLLDYSLQNAGPEKKISISINPKTGGTKMIFSGLVKKKELSLSTNTEILAGAISAAISCDDVAGEIYLDLPGSMEGSLINELFAPSS